jgi:TolA-binding protein
MKPSTKFKIVPMSILVLLLIGVALAAAMQGENLDEMFSFAGQLKKDKLYEAAAQQFIEFATNHPRDSRAPLALEEAADCLALSGDEAKAIQVLETLIETYPESADLCRAKVRLGRLYFNQNRYADADRIYGEVAAVMTDCPLYPDALLGKGEALIPLKKFSSAADLFATIVRDHLDNRVAPRAFYNLAFCQRRLDKPADALATYARLIETFPKNPLSAFACIESGKMKLEAGDSLAAIEKFKAARQFEEQAIFVPATLAGARILDATGDSRSALEWYRQVLDLSDWSEAGTTPAEVFGDAARAAYHAGDHGAVSQFAKWFGERHAPAFSPELTYYESLSELDQGRPQQAMSLAGQLEAHAPGGEWTVKAAQVRGDALAQAGRPREAISELRRFVSASADSAAKCRALETIAGVFMTAVGDTGAAIDALQERLEVEKRRFPGDLLQVARRFESAGRYQEAGDLYREISSGFPLAAEAGQARNRLMFIEKYILIDPLQALRLMDQLALDVTALGQPEGRLKLAEARLEIEKDPDTALELLSELKSSLQQSPQLPELLYLEGACFAARADRFHLQGDEKAARDELGKTKRPWRELEDRHRNTDWAARAAVSRVLLESSVAGSVDTTAVFQVLAGYPKFAGRSALLALLGDSFSEGKLPGHSKRALVYYQQALNLAGSNPPAKLELKVAQALAENGRPAEALPRFERLIGDPDNGVRLEAVYGAGKALRELKRYQDAQARFLEAARGGAGNFTSLALLQAADCQYMLGRTEESLASYREVQRVTRDQNLSWEIGFRIGLCLKQLGRNREALAALESCLNAKRGGETRIQAYTLALELAAETGDKEKDRRLLERYTNEFKNIEATRPAKRRLTRLFLELDAPAPALDLAKALAAGTGAQAEDEALLVMALYRNGQLAEARSRRLLLEQKVGADSPLVAGMIVEETKYHYDQKDYVGAAQTVAELAKQCRGDSTCEEALYLYSVSLIAQDQVDEGTRQSQRFFQQFPLSRFTPRLHLKLGNVLSLKYKRPNEALSHFQEAAATAEDSAVAFEALKNSAITLQNLSRWNQASDVWTEVLHRFPNSNYTREASLNVARCKMEVGDYKGAVAAYEDALPLVEGEDRARAYYWLGTCHQTLGDCTSAIVEYLKVPYLLPGEAMWAVTAQLKAAECYVAIQRYDSAKEIYNRVIQKFGAASNWGRVADKALREMNAGPAGAGSGEGGKKDSE